MTSEPVCSEAHEIWGRHEQAWIEGDQAKLDAAHDEYQAHVETCGACKALKEKGKTEEGR